MKWRKRLFLSLSVFVCLSVLCLNSLTASALSIGVNLNADNYEVVSVKVQHFNSESWVDPSSYSFNTLDNNAGRLVIGSSSLKYWRAKFTPKSSAGSLSIQPYMELNCNIYYTMQSSQNYAGQTITGALYLTAPNGTVYEFPVTDQIDLVNDSGALTGYHVQIGGTVDVGTGFDTGECSIELIMSGISNATVVDVSFFQLTFNATETITDNTVQIVDSIEQGFSDLQEQQAADAKETHGLLGTIIEYIKNLPSNLWSLFKNALDGILVWLETIKGAIDGVLTGVLDLPDMIWALFGSPLNLIIDKLTGIPNTLWTLIENGLIKLFVPDEQFIISYKDMWESCMEERFGAVWQCTTIVWDGFNSIQYADQTNTIELPVVTIDLPDNETFSFGGYNVQVVPAGFEFIVTILKGFVGMCSTLLFIRGLRKRYDKIVEANS